MGKAAAGKGKAARRVEGGGAAGTGVGAPLHPAHVAFVKAVARWHADKTLRQASGGDPAASVGSKKRKV